jgi:uncharacterized membrane protein YbaN (DUF454 family)
MTRILEILVLPLFATLFFVDRVVLLFMWNKSGHRFGKWLYNETLMLNSVIRVFIFMTVFSFVFLFAISE